MVQVNDEEAGNVDIIQSDKNEWLVLDPYK